MELTGKASAVVDSFGEEWGRFSQSPGLIGEELRQRFESYFSLFPWNKLPASPAGFDLGCGTGRWAKFVAPRVGSLYCIDPSNAIDIAKVNLADCENIVLVRSTIEELRLPLATFDFGFSIGVLHHVEDTQGALTKCVSLLRPGAPFLLYLYYRFDNRPTWFRLIWQLSNFLRSVISKLPFALKSCICDVIAGCVYFPLARAGRFLERAGCDVSGMPLSYYRNLSFYTMRTDALDRFGTALEKRFTRKEIQAMMEHAGLTGIEFSPNPPFWCAVGYKVPVIGTSLAVPLASDREQNTSYAEQAQV